MGSAFADRVRYLLDERGLTLRSAAASMNYNVSFLSRVLNGRQEPSEQLARALDTLLRTDGELWALVAKPAPVAAFDDEEDAWELARRVAASDVGRGTLERMERAFHELATSYPRSAPQDLLGQVRKHHAYVLRLLDARKTLSEHRQLLILGGWFSLLGATLHVDLNQQGAATARLETATTLAREAEFPEIQAWAFETEAWRVLTAGDYVRAVELSRAGQALAPAGTSAHIQASAQEGRAHARLGDATATYAAIDRVQALSASLSAPDAPEHHYQYDPAKSLAYTATTLAWLGDGAAEPYAREVISRLSAGNDPARWPRRMASANLDLSLSLLPQGRMDEACDAAQKAMLSGKIVPSNHWRALEVVKAVESRNLPEAKDLRDAYQDLRAISR